MGKKDDLYFHGSYHRVNTEDLEGRKASSPRRDFIPNGPIPSSIHAFGCAVSRRANGLCHGKLGARTGENGFGPVDARATRGQGVPHDGALISAYFPGCLRFPLNSPGTNQLWTLRDTAIDSD